MSSEHVINFIVTLTALSPLHVGSGQEILKKNFLFDSKNNTITFYDMEKFFDLIVKYDMVDQYEKYMLGRSDRLEDAVTSRQQFSDAELYSVSTAGIFDREHTLTSVKQFMRTPDNRPYIPGSSLKGALRTAILHSLIKEGAYTENDFDRNEKRAVSRVESGLVDTLHIESRKPVSAPCKSILRGLSVSDSEPVSNSRVILSEKYDRFIYESESRPNVVSECVLPGTKFRFAVSIDTSLLDIAPEKLINFVRDFFSYYRKTYLSKFDIGEETLPKNDGCCIILGGGSGYFAKNIAYKMLGFEQGKRYVSNYMVSKFKKHKHESDYNDGISPHMLKCTKYNGSLVQLGVCSLEIEK